MPTDLFAAAWGVLQGGILVFYWWHCARPSLVYAGARRRTLWVVATIGVVSWVSGLALGVVDRPARPAISVLLFASATWYLAAWPAPELVARFSGGRDPLGVLRLIIWGLGTAMQQVAKGVDEPKWRKRAASHRDRLARFSRTTETDRLIDLWLREAAIMLDGQPALESDSVRHSAIAEENRQLWPPAQA